MPREKIDLGIPRKWVIIGAAVIAAMELGVWIAGYIFRR